MTVASLRNLLVPRTAASRPRARRRSSCADAMAKGEKVEVEPKSFLVTGGELTLYYKGLFNDTRKNGLTKQADAAWQELVAKKKK
jgi:hypothetical protein